MMCYPKLLEGILVSEDLSKDLNNETSYDYSIESLTLCLEEGTFGGMERDERWGVEG